MSAQEVLDAVAAGKVPTDGNCYRAAVLLLEAEVFWRQPSKLRRVIVHAEVGGAGPIEGLRFGHAWVEDVDSGLVYDRSNGNEIVMPWRLYYALGRVDPQPGKLYRYTPEEARAWLNRAGHYGPWELKTETGL